MKVAIYHPWIYLKSGLERTILELVKRSRHDWTIYTSHFDPEGTYPEFRDLNVKQLEAVSVKRNYTEVLKGALRLFTTTLPLDAGEPLVICCDGLGSLLNFRHQDHPLVSLCFTPLRAVYDEEYRKRHLKKHRRLLPMALAAEWAYARIDRRAWKHYDRVFCISETVKRRVVRGGLYPENRIEIAYPGIDGNRVERSNAREKFFFLPGRIMWTKNLELGIDAFREFQRRFGKGFRLVIAGMVDRKSQPYFESLRARCEEMDSIEFLVDPSDEVMRDHYRRCYAVLFTAFNEDWGLTPLEGMAVGKPAVAVKRGGPTEIMLDRETGILSEPTPLAFAAAMEELARNPEWVETMADACLKQSLRYTWDCFVELIDDALDQLSTSTHRRPELTPAPRST